MKKGVKIAIAAGVAGAAYILWKKWGDIFPGKGDPGYDTETPVTPELPSQTATAPASTAKPSNGGPSPYETAVARLQELLGVAVDMNPGLQTNGKLEYMFSVSEESLNATKAQQAGFPNLNKYGKGVVTPDNVNWYIQMLQNHWTPRELTPFRRIGESLKAAKKGWFLKRVELPLVVGAGGSSYKLTGGYYDVPATTEYEVVDWSWQNAALYIRIKINGVPRVLQVYGPNLNKLSTVKVFKLY